MSLIEGFFFIEFDKAKIRRGQVGCNCTRFDVHLRFFEGCLIMQSSLGSCFSSLQRSDSMHGDMTRAIIDRHEGISGSNGEASDLFTDGWLVRERERQREGEARLTSACSRSENSSR